MSKLFHPNVERFIGFIQTGFEKQQKPVIVTEYFPKGSLKDVLNMSKKGFTPAGWDETKQLIAIYGIEPAMSFLHSNKIIHRDLKPDNILMDENLIPKIADFGLSKVQHSDESMTNQSTAEYKGTPIYMAPEIWDNCDYTPACDVFSFAIIVYEIVTLDDPFPNIKNRFALQKKILSGGRPEFVIDPPDAYKNLIELCWRGDPSERPTFDEILEELNTNNDFITDLVDERIFSSFKEYINQSKATYDKSKQIIKIDQFMKNNRSFNGEKNVKKSTNSFRGVLKIGKKTKDVSYPSSDFSTLSEECKQLVIRAETDPNIQSYIGKCLIEELDDFPQNTALGIQYLKNSISKSCMNAVIYYSSILIKGEVIPKDLEKAQKMLKKYTKEDNAKILFLYGKVKKKVKEYSSAWKYFEKASKEGSSEAMYECGKLLLNGKGVHKNEKKATKYFQMSKKNGFLKSAKYLPKVDEEQNINMKSYSESPRTTSEFINNQGIKAKSFKERLMALSYSMNSSNQRNEQKTTSDKPEKTVIKSMTNSDKEETSIIKSVTNSDKPETVNNTSTNVLKSADDNDEVNNKKTDYTSPKQIFDEMNKIKLRPITNKPETTVIKSMTNSDKPETTVIKSMTNSDKPKTVNNTSTNVLKSADDNDEINT